LRAIGFSGKAPLVDLPNVPPVRETLPSFDIEGSWEGWLAPAKTPPAIVTQLNGVIRASLKMPALHDAIVKAGYEPTDMSPEEFSTFLHAEAGRYAEAVKAAKIEPQ
jgi:tripartite-type tricarboxylate transporter receptor subunit TctC